MCRLTLSQEDKEVRDWLIEECASIGCEVKVDQMGNIFAVQAGTVKCRKPIAMGSHLDTQPAGRVHLDTMCLLMLSFNQEVDTMEF